MEKFSADVHYNLFPNYIELKKEFGEFNVSTIFDNRSWALHSSCLHMDMTCGMKQFAIAKRQVPNSRCATHEELYYFHKAHPAVVNIAAPGSFVILGGREYYAGIFMSFGVRTFGRDWADSRWRAKTKFLYIANT